MSTQSTSTLDMTAPSSVDDRPAEDLTTRARIRDAAMAEFADKGYRGATMRGIATAAEVSLGLVQHYFGTKDGLRAACDERVLQLVDFKIRALESGRIGDQDVLATLLAMAPSVQRYVGRALVDGSPRMADVMDRLTASGEEFLRTWWPDRYEDGTRRTRDAAAVLITMNTGPMVMQDHLARQLEVEAFSEQAIKRIGLAMVDVIEALADFMASDTGTQLRAGIEATRHEAAMQEAPPTTRSET